MCWGVGGGKERCVGSGELWESVWGEWESMLESGAPTHFPTSPHSPHLSLHLPLLLPHSNILSYTSSHTSSHISPSSPQIWVQYSIIELIDTRYLKIELIDTDTQYFKEVLSRCRRSYRQYKYLDTISGKKSIKKIGLQMNQKKKLLQVCTLRTIAKHKNTTYLFIFVLLHIYPSITRK